MDSDNIVGTVFRDVITLALAGFVAIVILILPYINKPTELDSTKAQGNILVELDWPPGIDVDIDMWVKAPGDAKVGYMNKAGKVFNLLRDDLGTYNDLTPYNHETVYSRGIPDGEYTINVHSYANRVNVWPIPCFVTVTITPDLSGEYRDRIQETINLLYLNQELTVVNFTIRNGVLDRSSVNQIFTPIRSGTK